MSVIIQAGKRNPQVYRKLIRFKGCLAGNIVDKTNESIVPIEFLKKYQEEILKANGEKTPVDISYGGKQYHTKVSEIHMDEENNEIDEIEFAVVKQIVRASDRATLLNLMVGINGYTLCSGIICEDLNGSDYCAVKLKTDETMIIGYISRENAVLSEMGQKYIEELSKYKENVLAQL